MPALLDIVTQHLDGDAVRTIGERTGIPTDQLRASVSAALPLIVGALARRANESRSGARAVEKVVATYGRERLPDVIVAYEGAALDGDGEVLRQIFGEQHCAVVEGLEAALDVPAREAAGVLEVVGGILMVGLAQVRERDGLNEDKLASLLNRERGELERAVRGRPRPRLLDFLDGNDMQVAEQVAVVAAAVQDAGVIDLLFGSPHVD